MYYKQAGSALCCRIVQLLVTAKIAYVRKAVRKIGLKIFGIKCMFFEKLRSTNVNIKKYF